MFKQNSKVKFRYPISGIPAGAKGTISKVVSRSGSYEVHITAGKKKAVLTVDSMADLDGVFIQPDMDTRSIPHTPGPHRGPVEDSTVEDLTKSADRALVEKLVGELGPLGKGLTVKEDDDGVRVIPNAGNRHKILELFQKLKGEGVDPPAYS